MFGATLEKSDHRRNGLLVPASIWELPKVVARLVVSSNEYGQNGSNLTNYDKL
jgi:hypothetical protein